MDARKIEWKWYMLFSHEGLESLFVKDFKTHLNVSLLHLKWIHFFTAWALKTDFL